MSRAKLNHLIIIKNPPLKTQTQYQSKRLLIASKLQKIGVI
jgi:hypothetical protein